MQETPVLSLGCEDPLRRERLPTPVFWPGEFHGLYSPWGHKETTEPLSLYIDCSQSFHWLNEIFFLSKKSPPALTIFMSISPYIHVFH